MNIMDIINFLAPLILTFLVQGIKKLIAINGYVALAVVFVIGGVSALLGIGPAGPNADWTGTAVNAGWIIGLANFIYSLIKKRS